MNDKKYIKEENRELNGYYKEIISRVGHAETTDNIELDRWGKYFLKRNFVGVYPSDLSPKMNIGQSCILNIDNSKGEGIHWTALYRHNSNTFLFFDSYGYQYIENIPNLKKYLRKKNELQDINIVSCETIRQWTEYQTYCGQISLAWLLYLYNQPNPLMAIVI